MERESAQTPCESKGEGEHFEAETTNLLKTNILKNIKTRKQGSLDSTFTASYVPNEFIQAVKPFFDDAATIEDFWKSVYLDTKAISHLFEPETITYIAINAFKQAIRSYKRGKIQTNVIRYFTGTFKRLMDQTYSELPLAVF